MSAETYVAWQLVICALCLVGYLIDRASREWDGDWWPWGYPDWLPYIGWTDASPSEAVAFDLDPAERWRMFVVQWFGYGFTILAQRKGAE